MHDASSGDVLLTTCVSLTDSKIKAYSPFQKLAIVITRQSHGGTIECIQIILICDLLLLSMQDLLARKLMHYLFTYHHYLGPVIFTLHYFYSNDPTLVDPFSLTLVDTTR